MAIRIGLSGWSYPHWRGGAYYPAGLPIKRELAHVSSQFSSLEINRSFYALLTPASCAAWRDATPRSFVFALKGSSFITHSKKLRGVDTALANFFAAGPLALGPKLGPIVWQLPERLKFDAERLAAFFALLPRTTAEAAMLAAQHDDRLKRGVHLEIDRPRKLRHAIEPRHASFLVPEFAQLARKHRVAIAVADSASWPRIEEVTADFVYVRLHGGAQTYASAYTPDEITAWAGKIRSWLASETPPEANRLTDAKPPKVRDVYVYFDNDGSAHAPRDAAALMEKLASSPVPAASRSR